MLTGVLCGNVCVCGGGVSFAVEDLQLAVSPCLCELAFVCRSWAWLHQDVRILAEERSVMNKWPLKDAGLQLTFSSCSDGSLIHPSDVTTVCDVENCRQIKKGPSSIFLKDSCSFSFWVCMLRIALWEPNCHKCVKFCDSLAQMIYW